MLAATATTSRPRSDRLDDPLEQALRGPRGLARLRDRREHNRELVAAEPRGGVARAHRLLDAAPEPRQHCVADVVPEAVVHLLEVVQVDEEEGGLLLVLLAECGCALQLLVEEGAVREPGERVVQRHLSQLSLCLPLGGDVQQVALQVERPAVVAEHDDAFVAHPDDPAVPREQPVLDGEGLVGRVRPRVRGQDAIAVLGVKRPHEESRVGSPLLDRVAEQGLDLRAREDVRAGGIERVDVHDERKLLDERPITAQDVVVRRGLRRRGRTWANGLHEESIGGPGARGRPPAGGGVEVPRLGVGARVGDRERPPRRVESGRLRAPQRPEAPEPGRGQVGDEIDRGRRPHRVGDRAAVAVGDRGDTGERHPAEVRER